MKTKDDSDQSQQKTYSYDFFILENNQIVDTKTIAVQADSEADAINAAVAQLDGLEWRYTQNFRIG